MKSAWLVAAAVLVPSAVLLSQQNSTAPQPRADALPAVGPAQPKFGRPVPRPDGMLPKVPAGFTVTIYAELPAPRMMVYAPNGDLFVSSPTANSITVLRDANNDGGFGERAERVRAGRAAARTCWRWRRAARWRPPGAAGGRGACCGESDDQRSAARRQRAGVHGAAGRFVNRARASSPHRSAWRSTTATSTSATPPRSSATSTRTAT